MKEKTQARKALTARPSGMMPAFRDQIAAQVQEVFTVIF